MAGAKLVLARQGCRQAQPAFEARRGCRQTRHSTGLRTILFLSGKKEDVAPYIFQTVRSIGVKLNCISPSNSAKNFVQALARAAEERGLNEWSVQVMQPNPAIDEAEVKVVLKGNGRQVSIFFESDIVRSRERFYDYVTVRAMLLIHPEKAAEKLLDVPTGLPLIEHIRTTLSETRA
ncbi:hypothetical protein HY992_06010 [Candidatus Micrarchaeota archaeon]|nr:hypothetical protein [Candidatus Micrarchaeota archaeon]